ncbi:sensor histidine kinase [Parahaliea mediterranea]|uniref:histidine kinase n=1 Tax=Parahaliea mediterranea TaxID=651086 RepID=A0A939DFH8_9GAMM|nr:HAMP domain-containing sensor histidine kinase [Parahaliea mediterranea]MBN7797224.1 HAMP domain-containing histidine kinase [Parahaliea mediterranea]
MRLPPTTLKARAMIVLSSVFLLSHVVGLMVYEYNRDHTIVLTEATDLADRIIGIVQLANAFPHRDRERILAASETQFLAMFPDTLPPGGAACRENDYARHMLQRFGRAFADQSGLEVEICVRDVRAIDDSPGRVGQMGFDVLTTIHFPDGERAVFHAVLPDDSSILDDPVLLHFAFVLLLSLALAGFLILKVVAPLGRLGRAAENIGIDIDSPPLAVEGPDEVRAAAVALNDMHTRLQRLIHNQRDIMAAVSHDLRSSLTRLQLRVDMLDDGDDRDGLTRVTADMRRMVQGVLDFVRGVDTDERPRRLELATLLESLCADLAEEGYEVRFLEPAFQPLVVGRPTALRRGFQNLILNAVKYGGSAEVALAGEGAQVVVSVRDRGPGIDEELLAEVMRPFYRVERSRSLDTGGVGLGLAIAQNVVQGHGGTLALHNHPGGGLVASVTLPRSQ